MSRYKKPKFFGKVMISQDGMPYLKRWYLIRTPWFSLRFHKILMSDLDRDLHDHPWDWISIMVKGSYVETTNRSEKTVKAGMINRHRARTPHKLTLLTPEVWTIFITGREFRQWGFHTPDGWVSSDKYFNLGEKVTM